MINYRADAINKCLELLNNLDVRGIENATRIAMIASILQNPEKGEDNGTIDKEEI